MAPAPPLQPLSSLSAENAQELAETEGAQAAYEHILPLDSQEHRQVKVLAGMLIHAPSPEGRTYIVESIKRCTNNEEVVALGQYFDDYFVNYCECLFLISFRANNTTDKANGHSSSRSTSIHPSRPSIETLRERISTSIVPPPANHSDSKRQVGPTKNLVRQS